MKTDADIPKDILTVPEAAMYLNISEAMLRRYVDQQQIPYFRVGARILFSIEALRLWVQGKMILPLQSSEKENPLDEKAKETVHEIWFKMNSQKQRRKE